MLSRALLSAARTASLYPGDHPVVGASVKRLTQAIAAAADAGITAPIAVTPTTLLVGGAGPGDHLSGADSSAISDAASLLHVRGILEIAFDPVVPTAAVGRLLAFLVRLGTETIDEGTIAEAWTREGQPTVRIEAIDYRVLLEQRQARSAASQQDDIWRAIVSALQSGRQTFDEQEQQRLLELAGDPGALAGLAETLMADKCTPEGAPLVGTQAATVLACFRHLASIAAVIAPDRARDILSNLAGALLRLDPHVSMQVLSLETSGAPAGPPGAGGTLAASLSEEAVAQLLATVVALEGTASPRLAQMFELLVPDRGRQRLVLDQARTIVEAREAAAGRPFDAFWTSIEELLLSYNDEQFVSEEYRAVLDGARSEAHGTPSVRLAEMAEWLDTLGEPALRDVSVALLVDLLRLEPAGDRAGTVLNHMADLADELLVGGAFGDALRVVQAMAGAAERKDLATAAAHVLDRLGAGAGVRETVATLGELDAADWEALERCYVAIGPSVLVALLDAVLADQDTSAASRAGAVFVALGEAAVAPLAALLERAGSVARRRVAGLLGRIGSPSAVPALQMLMRMPDPRVVQAAVAAIAGIDDPAAARAIHVALRATDGQRRESVVNALVAVHDRRVVPMLMRVLQECRPLSADFQVTLHALDALARLADARAVPSITRVMTLRAWLSRRRLRTLKRSAVDALARIEDPSARTALDSASQSGDRMLRSILRAYRAAGVA